MATRLPVHLSADEGATVVLALREASYRAVVADDAEEVDRIHAVALRILDATPSTLDDTKVRSAFARDAERVTR